jgi:hypothetical protein
MPLSAVAAGKFLIIFSKYLLVSRKFRTKKGDSDSRKRARKKLD